MDGHWGLSTFAEFIDDALEPNETFNYMDFNNDGYLTYSELVYYLQLFDDIDFYKTLVTDSYIYGIFNYSYDNSTGSPDTSYYEYLAQIWFQRLDNGIHSYSGE